MNFHLGINGSYAFESLPICHGWLGAARVLERRGVTLGGGA